MSQYSRRAFLRTLLAVSGSLSFGPSLWAARNAASLGQFDNLLQEQLSLIPGEKTRLERLARAGLLSLGLVVEAPEGKVRHLGWPVATQLTNGRTLVVYRRHPGHGDDEVALPSGRYVTYSDDLAEWLPKDKFSSAARLGSARGMHCVGSTLVDGRERAIVVTSGELGVQAEVFSSDDGGQSWNEHPDALRGMLKSFAHCGPNLVAHPEFGLTAAFGQEKGRKRRCALIRSLDGGQSWEEREWVNTRAVRCVEPSMAVWGPGHIALISREGSVDEQEDPATTAYGQHVYRHQPGGGFQEIEFVSNRTNILAHISKEGMGGNDTAEIIYNPVSQRLEVLQSHRLGGGPDEDGGLSFKKANSLNLWSIDPEALLAGDTQWRFDGTLLQRRGVSERGERDGLHPGGSVVDAAAGVQHIYFYAGWRRAPTSIFRLSRSLDTDKLRAQLGVA